MKEFFKDVIQVFYKDGIADILFIKSEEKYVAGVLMFYFEDEVLLYNSGIDLSFYSLSPGLLVVGEGIKRSIEDGKKVFDFLRGNERYKYDLGGKDKKLYHIKIP